MPSVAQAANWHDLLLVGSATNSAWGSAGTLGQLLLTCDLPCIVAPESSTRKAALDTIAIAWNGSSECARAMHAGAAGYLTKDSAPGELVKAINELMAGRRYWHTGIPEEGGAANQPEASRRAHDVLSDREYQVLRLIASGLTVSQIATRLSLSVKTISTYRARVLEKMKMNTTAELMHYAIQHGLVD